MSQPNIVLALFNQDENAHQQFLQDGSPIKRFNRMMQMENVANQFMHLLNQQDKETSLEKSERESEKKKISIGQRIKNKLQSTNNKSRHTQQNRNNISQFHYQNVSTPESMLYESNSRHSCEKVNEKASLYIDNEIKKKLNVQHKVKMIKSVEEYTQNERHSQIDSPLQNISAKTRKSSPNVDGSKQEESPSTPIDNLNNMSGMGTSQNKVKVLNFHSSMSMEMQVAQFKVESQRKQNGKNEQKVYKIRVKDVALTSSQQIASPASPEPKNSYSVNIMNVQSVCIPCSSNGKSYKSGYEYAIQQLQMLKANVQQLQRATDSLTKLTKSSVRLPSQIIYHDNQGKDQQNESLYEFFQQNLKGLLHQSSSQTILIDNYDNNKESRKYVYETPNQQWRDQDAYFSHQQLASNRILNFIKQQSQSVQEIDHNQQLFKGRCYILNQVGNCQQVQNRIKQKQFLHELNDSNQITFMAKDGNNKENECKNFI